MSSRQALSSRGGFTGPCASAEDRQTVHGTERVPTALKSKEATVKLAESEVLAVSAPGAVEAAKSEGGGCKL